MSVIIGIYFMQSVDRETISFVVMIYFNENNNLVGQQV